jgi:hypothetical protein
LSALAPHPPQSTAARVCPVCAWQPPVGKRTVDVNDVGRLERAVAEAKPGDTIRIADGTYELRRTLDIKVPNVAVIGRSGDPTRVILQGRGMTNDDVGVAVSVGAADVTIADVTIRRVANHAIQVRGENGASRFVLHNARLADTGQQMLKGSLSIGSTAYADDGLVACSQFAYTVSGPSDYTDGVDLIGASGWTIRDNRFERIRGPEAGAAARPSCSGALPRKRRSSGT